MRQSSQFSGQLSVADRTNVAERIIAFLRHRYPTKTADNVAADLGCSSETVTKMMDRMTTPNAVTFGRMILTYGPAFLIAVYPKAPTWLDEAHRRERREVLRAEQRRLQEQLDALGA
jgi:hypothetical protein